MITKEKLKYWDRRKLIEFAYIRNRDVYNLNEIIKKIKETNKRLYKENKSLKNRLK